MNLIGVKKVSHKIYQEQTHTLVIIPKTFKAHVT